MTVSVTLKPTVALTLLALMETLEVQAVAMDRMVVRVSVTGPIPEITSTRSVPHTCPVYTPFLAWSQVASCGVAMPGDDAEVSARVPLTGGTATGTRRSITSSCRLSLTALVLVFAGLAEAAGADKTAAATAAMKSTTARRTIPP
ncbi:hypothetical protein [Kitasatospora phosalacinea]|uniref:hypothetical protein n=1 Tax=Kitasatospora phosalacinea TaxID=2065 RepID=UPI002554DFED|nr:hypothetical protein [Kitasatospora phosalacinea]